MGRRWDTEELWDKLTWPARRVCGWHKVSGAPGTEPSWLPWESREPCHCFCRKSFASYVSQPHVRQLLVPEHNQVVAQVLNEMVSNSLAMMSKLWKLQKLLQLCGVEIESRWFPSAVNKFADAFSCIWDPGDMQVSEWFVEKYCEMYNFERPAFLVNTERALSSSSKTDLQTAADLLGVRTL